MTDQEKLREEAEKLIRSVFVEGGAGVYVSYNNDLEDVCLDGDFDLTSLVDGFISLIAEREGEMKGKLPEEMIVHSYMDTQGNGHSKEYCEGWNDYRMVLIDALFNTESHE